MHVKIGLCPYIFSAILILTGCVEKKEKLIQNSLVQCNIDGHVASVLDTLCAAELVDGKEKILKIEGTALSHFNEDGYMTHHMQRSGDGQLLSKISWKFYRGAIIECRRYKGNGQLYSVTNYENKDNQIQYETTRYFNENVPVSNQRSTYYYSKGRIDSIVSRIGLHKRTLFYSYRNNSKNYKKISVNYNGDTTNEFFKMDNKKRVVKQVHPNYTVTQFFDEQDNLVQSVTDNETTLYKYKFDKKKNWIEQRQYDQANNGIPVLKRIVKRSIIYY